MSVNAHIERVKSLPCLICKFRLGIEQYGVDAHHAGEATDRDDYAVVPLCPEHHQGSEGVHGLHRRGFERRWKVNDVKLLAWTNKLLARH